MSSGVVLKRFSSQRHPYFYSAPEPMAHGRAFGLAMTLVSIAAIGFCVYFIVYLLAQHNAFMTNAEDLGIMDQAFWNTLHGRVLQQTICNLISDTNCASPAGLMRFAIHFEPILFLITPLYFLFPGPKTLLVLQTLVVALGAYPAFWLARLRLRNDFFAIIFALLYLLYPAQQMATGFDFHAVTFTTSLLLFTLYFLYTRRTGWMFLFAVLSLSCKEEIAALIVLFGIWSIILQRRVWSGLALSLLGCTWALLTLFVIMPHFSPVNHPLLVSRYQSPAVYIDTLVFHPLTFFRQYVFDPLRLIYLQRLLAPAGLIPYPHRGVLFCLPLLAPWVLVLAVPTLLLNLLSSNQQMYSDFFHYDAEIVPIIIFSSIEACVLILWFGRTCLSLLIKHKGQPGKQRHVWAMFTMQRWNIIRSCMLCILAVWIMGSLLFENHYFNFNMPLSANFRWPVVTDHQHVAESLIATIPADASVSAQTRLVPHLSQRQYIYMFPYQDSQVEYVFVDVQAYEIFPYETQAQYQGELVRLLTNGKYGVSAMQDGYLLLKRGLPPPKDPMRVLAALKS